MINENLAKDTINLLLKSAKADIDTIIKAISWLNEQNIKAAGKTKQAQISMKDLIKTGAKLESIPVEKTELKGLKKELNKNGVNFSVYKNKEDNTFSIFFQAKDVEIIDKTFKNVVTKFEKKEALKQNIKSKINEFKRRISPLKKDVVKSKQPTL